ncbi:MAG: hypothetical protein IH987_20120, partial [Planctomycetes bacterium]|nr:hypothetical protein [Planctomycetota bacterium]
CATLTGDELEIIPDPSGGEVSGMTLTQNMVLTIANTVEVVGCSVSARGGCTPPARGGCTPPLMHIQGDSDVSIGGDLSIGGDPSIDGGRGLGGDVDFVNDSTNPITMQGDFAVAGQNAACFNSSSGGMTMDGGSAANRGVGVQSFEVAGQNLGPMIVDDLIAVQFNFALNSLEISQNSNVVFQNNVKNATGPEPGDEALYVRTLTLGSGSSITIDETILFYETLVLSGAGATATLTENSKLGTTGTCPMSDMPLDEPQVVRKNRYISFEPGNPGALTAIRVTHVDTGRQSWVEAHFEDNPPNIFRLGPGPYFRDWGGVGVIDVGDCDIVPLASYLVDIMPIGCDPEDPASFSAAQDVETSVPDVNGRWGDTVGEFVDSPPQGTTNILDVVAAIRNFQVQAPFPPLSWVDMEPQVPNGIVNINDAFKIIIAFRGEPYPYGCPDNPCQDNVIFPCQ